MIHPVVAVAQFMKLGGQYVPDDVDREITTKDICQFIDRIDEEAEETFEASGFEGEPFASPSPVDFPGVLDGFIDAAYAALTGAVRVAGTEKAMEAWDAVVDANLSKVDGRYGPPVINKTTGKIGKPKGWVAPNIEEIINR